MQHMRPAMFSGATMKLHCSAGSFAAFARLGKVALSNFRSLDSARSFSFGLFAPFASVAFLILFAGQAHAQATVTVVEYYNAALDHYFISPLQPDIDALDSGRLAGWARTGQSFQAFPGSAATPLGAS